MILTRFSFHVFFALNGKMTSCNEVVIVFPLKLVVTVVAAAAAVVVDVVVNDDDHFECPS